MRYRLQRHDGTDCSATMVPITVLRMVPIQRYRQGCLGSNQLQHRIQVKNIQTDNMQIIIKSFFFLSVLQSDSSEYKNLKIRLYLFLSSCLPMTKKPMYSYPRADPDRTGTDSPDRPRRPEKQSC